MTGYQLVADGRVTATTGRRRDQEVVEVSVHGGRSTPSREIARVVDRDRCRTWPYGRQYLQLATLIRLAAPRRQRDHIQ